MSHAHSHSHANHTSVHLIMLKNTNHGEELPSPLVKIRHVCKEAFYNWPDEGWQAMFYQYPLKFQSPYNESYFHNDWGVKGVGGYVRFRNVTENRFYNTPNITYVPGITLMPECHWQHHNPAHFMFPFSVLFEWGQSPPAHLPVFDRLMQMKCPSYGEYLYNWEWARIVEETSLAPLLEKGYFGKAAQHEALEFERGFKRSDSNINVPVPEYPAPENSTNPYSYMLSPKIRFEKDFPEYDSRGNVGREHRLFCFETLYIVQRWGILMSNMEYARAFREKAKSVYNKRYPKEIITTPELNDDPIALHQRCTSKSVRILVHQRSPDHRIFLNTQDILSTASNFTSHARLYDAFLTKFAEQVQLYNSFDILITTTGSHLTNLVFTNRTNVLILEVGLAIRDWFWRENAFRFGIRHYLYSHIGHIPSPKCYADGKVDNTCVRHPSEEDTIVCPPRGDDTWHPIGDCSLTVNITTFTHRLQQAVDTLCDSVAPKI